MVSMNTTRVLGGGGPPVARRPTGLLLLAIGARSSPRGASAARPHLRQQQLVVVHLIKVGCDGRRVG